MLKNTLLKKCIKCAIEKNLSLFTNRTRSKDGKKSTCIQCDKKHRQENRDDINRKSREYNKNNPDKIKKYSHTYINKNKEKIAKESKEFYRKNIDKMRSYYTSRYQLQKDVIKSRSLEYYYANKEKILNRKSIQIRKKYSLNPVSRLSIRIRSIIGRSIRRFGYTKKSHTHEILGCSFTEFKYHIEKQFKEGMNWDNRSEWHLDHIIPLSSATTEDDVIRLNHYSNFQPLWAIDNMNKSAKMPDELEIDRVRDIYNNATKKAT